MQRNYPFEYVDFPFSCSEFTPYIDPDTLYIHCNILYRRYVDNLNAILAQLPQYQTYTLYQLLTEDLNLPVQTRNNILFNAGGIYNHEFYFFGMSKEENEFSEDLSGVLISQYGSVEEFFRLFTEAAMSLQGSGWIWLAAPGDGSVHIVVANNHNVPNLKIEKPIFVMDMWEHAYFLKYHANKKDYIDAWIHLLDKERASRMFAIGSNNFNSSAL